MKIRRYDHRDKDQIVELWKNIFPITSPRHEPEFSIQRKVQYKDDLFFVAVENTQIIGTVMGGYDGHRGWIYSLAVHQKYRRKGIGTALIRYVENALRELDCPKINLQILESNSDVVQFYQTLGFDIEPRLSMGKCL